MELFDECMTKSVVTYTERMERMSNDRWLKRFACGVVRKVCMEKGVKDKVNGCGLQCVRLRLNGGAFDEGWMILNRASERREWTVKDVSGL